MLLISSWLLWRRTAGRSRDGAAWRCSRSSGSRASRFQLHLWAFFWGSSFNDGTTQTALDPLMLGGRLAPLKSVYFGSNEGRGPVPSVQP